jgi:hypothetical protein
MKERKKRTTIKEAFDNGYKMGEAAADKKFVDLIDMVLEDYEQEMFDHPRNTKFTEIEMDAIKDLRERLIYKQVHRV